MNFLANNVNFDVEEGVRAMNSHTDELAAFRKETESMKKKYGI
jgi:hypothetical protein